MSRPRRSPPPSLDVGSPSPSSSSGPRREDSSPTSPAPLGFSDLRSRFEHLSATGGSNGTAPARQRTATKVSSSPRPLPTPPVAADHELAAPTRSIRPTEAAQPIASSSANRLPPTAGPSTSSYNAKAPQRQQNGGGQVHEGLERHRMSQSAERSNSGPMEHHHKYTGLLNRAEAGVASAWHSAGSNSWHLHPHEDHSDNKPSAGTEPANTAEVAALRPASKDSGVPTGEESAHKARRPPPPRPPKPAKLEEQAQKLSLSHDSDAASPQHSIAALRNRFEAARIEDSGRPLEPDPSASAADPAPGVSSRVPLPALDMQARPQQLSGDSSHGGFPSGLTAALEWADRRSEASSLSPSIDTHIPTLRPRAPPAPDASTALSGDTRSSEPLVEAKSAPSFTPPPPHPRADPKKDAAPVPLPNLPTAKHTARALPPLPAPVTARSPAAVPHTKTSDAPPPSRPREAPPMRRVASHSPSLASTSSFKRSVSPMAVASSSTASPNLSSHNGVRSDFAPPLLRSAGRVPSPNPVKSGVQGSPSSSDSSESEDEPTASKPSNSLQVPRQALASGSRTPEGTSSADRPVSSALLSETLPDTSRANRRPPSFDPPRYAQSKHFSCFAAWGHTIATASGDKVRIYRIGATARQSDGGDKLCSLAAEHGGKEVKITSMAFRPSGGDEPDGRYLWCGTREGSLCEMDIVEATVQSSKHNLHTAPVVILQRVGDGMLSVDASGKICIWLPPGGEGSRGTLSLSQSPVAQRVSLEKSTLLFALDTQLWACSGSALTQSSLTRSNPGHSLASAASAKVAAVGFGSSPTGAQSPSASAPSRKGGHQIRIFNPFSTTSPFNATSRPLGMGSYGAAGVGAITCGTIVPERPDRVYLGHESGHVSVWDKVRMTCVGVQRLSALGFTAICVVNGLLWTGNRSGRITIYSPPPDGQQSQQPWKVLKSWPAHKGPVSVIAIDPAYLESRYTDDGITGISVVSAGLDYSVHVWDGLLSADWLAHRVSLRNDEFSTYRMLKSLHVTFNIDAASPSDMHASVESVNWLPQLLTSAISADGSSLPDIIYFGFQEIVDLEDKRLTAKSMLLNAASGKKAKADMGERISHQYRMWYDRLVQSVRLAMPAESPYRVVHSESMVGLFSCLFVRASEFEGISDAAVVTVKTGLGGRWGNKGSIVSRLLIDDTSCCIINAHLAAGQRHVKQRNEDIAQILESESLPIGKSGEGVYVDGGSGELILDHELVFLGGDLNYRIDLPRSQVINCIHAGQLDTLLPKDQLHQELQRNSPLFRLRGFEEADSPTRFAPTYKFDRGTQEYDTSDKSRVPAWCDRLLYRSAGVQSDEGFDRQQKSKAQESSPGVRCLEYRSWPEVTISDHRPVSAIYEFQAKRIDWDLREAVKQQEEEAWKQKRAMLVQKALAYYTQPR